MSRLFEWPARRAGALGGNGGDRKLGWCRAPLRLAIHISIAALALGTPIGAPAQDAPPGPHVRVKGLPAGVTLSGGQTNAERAWIVPLRGRGALKIEVPGGLAGSLDLNVALVGDNGDALAERGIALRVKPAVAATPSSEAAAAQRSEAADTPSVGLGGRPNDVSLGPHFRIKGLPADVTLSGGHTNAERPWAMPLADGKQAWMVPLWALDELKVEIPPGLAGTFDLVIALADNAGGVVAERAVALRVKPVVVAARSGRDPDAGERKDAAVATPALPPSGAASAAPSGREPDAGQREDVAVATPALPPSGAASDAGQREDVAVATPAPPPSGTAPAAASRPEPEPAQRENVAVATPALPPSGAASAASERACAVADCRPRAEELQQAERLVRQGDRYLAQGNIAIARQYFARAADLGLAIAALKIAETYDPNELARPDVYGVKPNLAEARRWYQRAFERDVPEAQARVQRLGAR
jgi:hypothetical protein